MAVGKILYLAAILTSIVPMFIGPSRQGEELYESETPDLALIGKWLKSESWFPFDEEVFTYG